MAIISDDYDLIEFFGVQGEAMIRPQGAMLNKMQSSSEGKEGRERKRFKFVDKYHLQGSCFISEEVSNSLLSREKTSRAIHYQEEQNQNVLKKRDEIIDGKKAEGSPGLQLVCLLLNCASAIAEKNKSLAMNLLNKLWSRVSISGNSIERVAAYFTEALSAKFKQINPSFFYNKLLIAEQPDEKMKEPEMQFDALVAFYRVSPFYQFAHLTANQAIIEAFEGHSHLHIIDFDISHGIQWSSLIQSLSEREDGPALCITGFGRDLNVLNATGTHLSSFAKSHGLTSFEFHPFVEGSKEITAENLQIKQEEIVAVNLVLYLNRLPNSQSSVYSRLRCIQSLKPAIVAVVEHEANHTPTTFLTRFMESLHYYAALFDSLDVCLPLKSAERLRIEKFHFGEKIKMSIREFDGGVDDMMKSVRETHDKWETWKTRMERGGFLQTGLSSRCVSQAKLLLQAKQQCNSFEGGGFRVHQRDLGKSLSLAWQDRQLILASAWRCKT
ncbi:hypothetical protein SUGI_0815760 [Cryptomeria japonica]|uniref:scarecrow-like protein 18 n=1 Tax=Cryptomeria japonica TaxID=3369 RepID=UPI0024148310|nr:scarecrow-like protein 18 [Cryptomeria japonica]GLJ39888.1 hypothetical protein SUGI_0815760 [Cryptomeria japonica]